MYVYLQLTDSQLQLLTCHCSRQSAHSDSGFSLTPSVLELLTENSLSGKIASNRVASNAGGLILASLLSFFPFLLL